MNLAPSQVNRNTVVLLDVKYWIAFPLGKGKKASVERREVFDLKL